MNMSENMEKAYKATIRILNRLSDFEWHRTKDLTVEIHVSSKTFYTKFLKDFGLFVEKREDKENGKYPYPVYYKLRPMLSFSPLEQMLLLQSELEDVEREFLERKSISFAMKQIRALSDIHLIKALAFFKDHNIRDMKTAKRLFNLFVWKSYEKVTLKLAELSIKFMDELDFEKAVKEVCEVKEIGEEE
jgi:hypothetical protein